MGSLITLDTKVMVSVKVFLSYGLILKEIICDLREFSPQTLSLSIKKNNTIIVNRTIYNVVTEYRAVLHHYFQGRTRVFHQIHTVNRSRIAIKAQKLKVGLIIRSLKIDPRSKVPTYLRCWQRFSVV